MTIREFLTGRWFSLLTALAIGVLLMIGETVYERWQIVTHWYAFPLVLLTAAAAYLCWAWLQAAGHRQKLRVDPDRLTRDLIKAEQIEENARVLYQRLILACLVPMCAIFLLPLLFQ